MNNEERIWLNNQLFHYTDETHGTDGTISVFASLSTADNKDFSPLRLCISIGNSDYNKKTCWLSFAYVNELITTIEEIIKPENLSNIYDKGNQVNIERKYSNKMFVMLFKKSNKDLSNCVLLGICSNENDRNVTILTFDDFTSFYSVLKQFRDNYFLIENMIINRYMKTIEIDELKSINSTLKTFPRIFEEFQDFFEKKMSNVVNNPHSPAETNVTNKQENVEDNSQQVNHQDPAEEDEDNGGEFEQTMNDFNSFLDDNVDKINIPEVENVEKEFSGEIKENKDTVEEFDNDFTNKILNNDINTLYTKAKNIIVEDCKILSFNKLFEYELGINPLESLDNKSLKSCIYLSELNIRQFTKQFYLYGKEYPSTCTLIRSNISEPTQFNKDLAYTLFMIHAYMKYYSNKMESRTNDQLASKTDFYINLRLFSDVFTYSILINEKPDIVKSKIKSMYQYFSKNGFFSKFDKELDDYNLDPISVDDISNFANVVVDKLPKTDEAPPTQDSMYENKTVKLPSENRFSIEQIINQIVNLELLVNFGLDIKENAHKFNVELDKIDKDILQIFTENKKINKQKEKQTNLYRLVKFYDNEVPDNVKESFYQYIKDLEYEDFDFVNCGFNLPEFGENIIKGLYQWNNSSNRKEKYSDFFYKCNETILNKNDILTRELNSSEEQETEEDWGDLI